MDSEVIYYAKQAKKGETVIVYRYDGSCVVSHFTCYNKTHRTITVGEAVLAIEDIVSFYRTSSGSWQLSLM